MASKKYTMGTDDWKTWAFNFFKFVLIPTALAFLTAYQLNLDVNYAYGVAVGTLFNSGHDWLRKFIAGK